MRSRIRKVARILAENEKDIELEEDKKTEENAEEVTEAEKTEQKPDNKT